MKYALRGVGLAVVLVCSAFWMTVLAVPLAVVGAVVYPLVRMIDLLDLAWDYLRIKRRWMDFAPPVVVFPGVLAFMVFAGPDTGGDFAHEYSGFFQSAAQVLVGLLIAIAIEARAIEYEYDRAAFKLSGDLAVVVLVLAGIAAMVGLLSPTAPALREIVLAVTAAGVLSSLLSVVVLGRRIIPRGSE